MTTTVVINFPSIPRVTQKLHISMLSLIAFAGVAATWIQASGPGLGIPPQDITYIVVAATGFVTFARVLLNTPQPLVLPVAPVTAAEIGNQTSITGLSAAPELTNLLAELQKDPNLVPPPEQSLVSVSS